MLLKGSSLASLTAQLAAVKTDQLVYTDKIRLLGHRQDDAAVAQR